MSRRILIFSWVVILIIPTLAFAGSKETETTLNLPTTPTSPGFTILGVEPASVERPTTPTDLKIAILNATNNLTTIPQNFALEFSPCWMIGGGNVDYKSKWAFWQTLSVSLATSSLTSLVVGDTLSRQIGIGAYTSLFQGEINPGFHGYVANLNVIYAKMETLGNEIQKKFTQVLESDTVRKDLNQKRFEARQRGDSGAVAIYTAAIETREGQILHRVEQEVRSTSQKDYDDIKDAVSKMQFRRVGWKWNAAGAFALDFPQGTWEVFSPFKLGAWTSVGYEWPNPKQINENITDRDSKWHASIFALGRFLWDFSNQDSSSIDIGGRVIATHFQKGISLSGETVGRFYLSNNRPDYRLAGILEYELARNTTISFTLGCDYDKGLIASLGFSPGFGSKRSFN